MVKRIVIVGLGSIGRRHLRLLRELHSDIEIILVRSGKGGNWSEERLATRIVDSIEVALDSSPQMAIVSSPAHVHLEQALLFAEAGIHLLIEKPLSVSSKGIDKLLEIVKQNRICAAVGYVLRYDPAARFFKECLQSKETGDLVRVRIECGSFLPEWRPDVDYRCSVSAKRELGGGVLLELSHEIDYLLWFFGKPAVVNAQLGHSGLLDVDVEDQADILMAYTDNLFISMHLDFVRRIPVRECVVQTTKGQLSWNVLQRQVTWQPVSGDGYTQCFELDRDEIYREQLRHFIRCIEEGEKPFVTLEDGANVMYMIDAIRQSHKLERRVSL